MDILGYALKSVGIILIFSGLVSTFITNLNMKNRIRTTGIVVNLKTKKRYVRGLSYDTAAAVVKYKVNNEEVIATDRDYRIKKALPYDVGSTVGVWYNKNNIKNFYTGDDKITPYTNSIVLILVGITTIVVALIKG